MLDLWLRMNPPSSKYHRQDDGLKTAARFGLNGGTTEQALRTWLINVRQKSNTPTISTPKLAPQGLYTRMVFVQDATCYSCVIFFLFFFIKRSRHQTKRDTHEGKAQRTHYAEQAPSMVHRTKDASQFAARERERKKRKKKYTKNCLQVRKTDTHAHTHRTEPKPAAMRRQRKQRKKKVQRQNTKARPLLPTTRKSPKTNGVRFSLDPRAVTEAVHPPQPHEEASTQSKQILPNTLHRYIVSLDLLCTSMILFGIRYAMMKTGRTATTARDGLHPKDNREGAHPRVAATHPQNHRRRKRSATGVKSSDAAAARCSGADGATWRSTKLSGSSSPKTPARPSHACS